MSQNILNSIKVKTAAALCFFSASAFGFPAKKDPFGAPVSKSFSESGAEQPQGRPFKIEIQAAVFEREDGRLYPKCRVSLKKHPEALPGFVKEAASLAEEFAGESLGGLDSQSSQRERPASPFIKTGLDGLEECPADISLALTERAEHFALHPQLAAAPFVLAPAAYGAGMALSSCALGALIGGWGGWQLADERETGWRERRLEKFEGMEFLKYLPTSGEFMTGIAPFLSAGLSMATSYTAAEFSNDLAYQSRKGMESSLRRKLETNLVKLITGFSGGLGFLCGVAGSPVGYFLGKTKIAEEKASMNRQRWEQASQKAEASEAALSSAQADLQKLTRSLGHASSKNAALRVSLDEAGRRAEGLRSDLTAAELRASRLQRVLELNSSFEGAAALAEKASAALKEARAKEAEKTAAAAAAAEVLKVRQIYVESLKADFDREAENVRGLERALEAESGLFAEKISSALFKARGQIAEKHQKLESFARDIPGMEARGLKLRAESEELSGLRKKSEKRAELARRRAEAAEMARELEMEKLKLSDLTLSLKGLESEVSDLKLALDGGLGHGSELASALSAARAKEAERLRELEASAQKIQALERALAARQAPAHWTSE